MYPHPLGEKNFENTLLFYTFIFNFQSLCDDIDAENLLDVANLLSNLAGNFEGVVQYNKDNRDFEVRFYESKSSLPL